MQNELTTPKAFVLYIFNDINRDCWYSDIIFKVMSCFPNMSDDEISECENYAIDLHSESCKRFETENVWFFSHTSLRDFEDACQDLTDDVCVNHIFRNEMYEFAVESSVFMDVFYAQGGKYVDYGGENFDHDTDNGMSYREQCDADRSDYADTFQCPIQRAEIRMGA